MEKTQEKTQVLVIGGGIAGATVALRAALDHGVHVTLITRESDPRESATRYAQGGIVGRDGHSLVADILVAGDGLSSPTAAHILAREGPRRVREVLVDQVGVEFDRAPNGNFDYAREAAHSERRVMHTSDHTGRSIEQAMIDALLALPNVTFLTDCVAIDLIVADGPGGRCNGAFVLQQGRVVAMMASATVLATGGVGAVYLRTTNPRGARGDGLAMADRAGAVIENAEYIQFHPTAFAARGESRFLISESVRGEGARLLSYFDRRPFMQNYAPEWKDLAPRDIVARAIYDQMLHETAPHVWLDVASCMPAEKIRSRFPTIHQHCLDAGIDMTVDPIPVRPAAHYSCGGVKVDEWGCTSIEGLYAVGEVSCTGVHGANRLASTSLLEGLVWGCRAAEHIVRHWSIEPRALPPASLPVHHGHGEARESRIESFVRNIRELMWRNVGVVRTHAGLAGATAELVHMLESAETLFHKSVITDSTIGLRNAARTALIISRAALANPHSRGCHYLGDEAAAKHPSDTTDTLETIHD